MSFSKSSMKTWGLVFSFFFTLLALLSTGGVDAEAQAFESESREVVVTSIEIVGNDNIETFSITSKLPFSTGDDITVPDDIMRGEIRIREMGFFQEVAGSFRENADGTGVIAVYDVFEHPVIQEIEISGNRNWNENKNLEIFGLSIPWPFTKYIVSPDRLFAILEEYGIERGEVFNSIEFQRALGIGDQGQCLERPPSPSICREYQIVKEMPFFGISRADAGDTVRIDLVEGVLEDVEIEGVEGPFQEKAEEIVSDMPILEPITVADLQTGFRNIVQSVYFEPIQDGDYSFRQGAGPDRLIMILNLSPNVLLEEPQNIQNVEFSGNMVFSSAELARHLEFEPGEMDNYSALEAIEGVHSFYQREGYIMAQITRESVENNTLTLNVNEGQISEIEIQQNSIPTLLYTEDHALQPIPLDEELAEEAMARAEEEGPSVLGIENEDHPVVKAVGAFSEFLSNVLGTSASSGLPYTQPEIIIKEMTLRPGEYLNQFELAETYRQLLGLEYFSDVLFDFQIDEETGLVKVIVNVQEQDRLGDFRFGGAVSEEGLVGQLSIRSKNLQGTGQDISVEFDRGILGKAVINWSFGYQNRTILENADYFSIDLFNRNSQEDSPRSHLLNRLGGEAALAYPIQDIQVVLGFRHEFFTKEFDVAESDQDETPSESDETEIDETNPDELQEPEIERGTSNVLSVTLNRDERNNPLFATRGSMQSLSIERAGLLAGSEVFTKVRGAWIQHLPTIQNQTIAARLVGGWGNDLPSQEQFVIGGSTTVRGIQPTFTNSMAFLNLEYRIQLEQGFSIAFFVDGGTDLLKQNIDLKNLKKSFGIEGRFTIPYAGPIRIAFAWPVTDRIGYFKAEFGFGTFF